MRSIGQLNAYSGCHKTSIIKYRTSLHRLQFNQPGYLRVKVIYGEVAMAHGQLLIKVLGNPSAWSYSLRTTVAQV
jgi:hypothetical protein